MLYQIKDGTVSAGGQTILSHIDFYIKEKEKRKGADQRGQLFYYSTEKLLSVLDEVAAALARAQLWR